MIENMPVYSIQRTYIIKLVSKPKKSILTCDERIDIPTIEPLPNIELPYLEDTPLTVIPCIELAGEFMSEINLTFETNEGVTVLPIEIPSGKDKPILNPYTNFRYLLVLPRGTTGVKSCKVTSKDSGEEAHHNFTFGIMPPPYNYDNMLFGYLMYNVNTLADLTQKRFRNLKISNSKIDYNAIYLPKDAQKQRLKIGHDQLFFDVLFSYSSSSEISTHRPKITLHGPYRDTVFTLALNKTKNIVTIDLFTGMITAYDSVNGKIIQQFMIYDRTTDFTEIIFENFDDIDTPSITVQPKGRPVV